MRTCSKHHRRYATHYGFDHMTNEALNRFPRTTARVTELMAKAQDGATTSDGKAIVDALNAVALALLVSSNK